MSISIIVEQNSLVIRSRGGLLDLADARACMDAFEKNRKLHNLVIFDFSKVETATPEALRELVAVAKDGKSEGTKLVMLAHPGFLGAISKAELEEVFHCFIQAPGNAPLAVGQDSSEKIKGFLEEISGALTNTLKTYAKLTTKTGDPYLANEGSMPRIEIAGSIGLVGTELVGTFTLGFPLETYFRIMGKMFSKEFNKLDPEIRDWAGEFVNVTFGQARTSLNHRGYGLQPGVPTVIHGNGMELVRTKNISLTVLPFECEAGPLWAYLATPDQKT